MSTFGVGETDVARSRLCRACGAAVPVGNQFCTACGSELAVPALTPSYAPPTYATQLVFTAGAGGERVRWASVAGLVVGAFAGPISLLSWVLPYASGLPAPIRDPTVGVGRVLAITATEVVFSIACVVALLVRGPRERMLVSALRGGAAWSLALGALALWRTLPSHVNSFGYWTGVLASVLMALAGVLLPLGGWADRPAGPPDVIGWLALVVALVEGQVLLREFVIDAGSAEHSIVIGLGLAGVLLLATRGDDVVLATWLGWTVFGLIYIWGDGLVLAHWGATDVSHLWRSSLGPAAMAALAVAGHYMQKSPARQGFGYA